ncbi:hypothetical protein NC99_16070 [Sunxiuqinia dokdonensis]|uniref:Uncharacterized protein n=1 Tax=Sunxiuqinia dokdonensis TaxID=1409788 RepID=A0A0L8VAS2_9BACT|nr:hypothetical protein NC99_16070 [Sunxiuqinia dokdonensis]
MNGKVSAIKTSNNLLSDFEKSEFRTCIPAQKNFNKPCVI